MTDLLMPKATAVWLIDNTALTFAQIADFCQLHDLEVQAIADGDVGGGIRGYDPVLNKQLSQDEITRCEADPECQTGTVNNITTRTDKSHQRANIYSSCQAWG